MSRSDGIIWAVRYAKDGVSGRGSIEEILTEEIDHILDELENRGDDGWGAADLAHALLHGLRMSPSGATAVNEVVRGGVRVGIPMIQRLEEMAAKAWRKEKSLGRGEGREAAHGRLLGLCQALAFVKSPTSYENGTAADVKELIVKELRNARATRNPGMDV